jgi:hypothetical protein
MEWRGLVRVVQSAKAPGDRDGVRRGERAFTLVEVMISASVLVVAILGFAASAFAGHSLGRDVADRRIAVETLGRFVERIRADPDWAGIYARLRPLSVESNNDAALARLNMDPTLPAHAATAYYSDFTTPASLGTVTFLVQVPVKNVGGVATLREDEVAPRYGLPRDLNGDGLIDGNARDTDNRALPIVARIRWQHPGEAAQEEVLATWLRGDR